MRQFASGLGQVVKIRLFAGYTLTAALSGFTMMAYIANSSYVLQEQNGLQPMPFALIYAATALSQVLLSVLNAKIVGRFRPRTLIGFGLTLASVAVATLAVGVFALGTPLVSTCAGFLVLMAVQAFIFGNASALAAGEAPQIAGAASAVLGVVQAVAMAVSAPLASSGGAETAAPMIWVMLVGVAGSLVAFLVIARPSARPVAPAPDSRAPVVPQYLVVANQTLGGPDLLDAIGDRMDRGPASFSILVPATPRTHLINDFNGLSCAFPFDTDTLPGAADSPTDEHAVNQSHVMGLVSMGLVSMRPICGLTWSCSDSARPVPPLRVCRRPRPAESHRRRSNATAFLDVVSATPTPRAGRRSTYPRPRRPSRTSAPTCRSTPPTPVPLRRRPHLPPLTLDIHMTTRREPSRCGPSTTTGRDHQTKCCRSESCPIPNPDRLSSGYD